MSRLFSIFYIFFLFIKPLSAYQNEDNTKEVIPISTPEQISSHYKSLDFLIGDIVNPLSGSLCLSNTDLIAKGAQNINLTRYYNPPYMPYIFLSDPDWNEEKLYEYIRDVYKGWRVFSHCELTPTYNDGSKIITKIAEPSGLTLEYEISKGQTKLIGDQYGISNIQNDNPSGKYDFRNTKVTISENGHKIIVLAADGTKRYYNSVNNSRYNFCLEKEVLPNGKVIRYNYNGNRLISIDSMDPKERFVYATISSHSISDLSKKYSSSCQKECFYNNDQRTFEKEIIYKQKVLGIKTKGRHFFSFPSPCILTNISSPFYKNESITYDKKFLMDKYLGKDLIFTCEYAPFQGSDYHFRIKKLCLPVGADDSFSPVYDINYDPAIAGKKEGLTSVKNINGTITKYYITKNLQIGSIQDFDKDGSLKREKAYTWLNNGWLNSIALKDGKGKIFYKKAYKYDGFGNPIEEIFTGDLKGNSKLDSYTIVRKFSQDNLNHLLEEKKEDGPLITYQYLPDTNLITEKYTQDNDYILLREFYEYDDSNNLIKKIEDDGSSLDKYDLETISKRTITKYNLRQAQPFLHMIESIEETYLQNGKEKLFKRIDLTYDDWGNVSKEDIYDANNSYSHSINKTYNERGDLLSETNPLKDKATFEYDDKGREKQSVNYSHKLTTNKEYDTKGRLKKIIKTGSDGIIHTNSNEYDESDNLIQKIDRFGNRTRFEYDLITGNVKTKTNPPILSIDNASLDVITNSTYNALGLETSFTDAKGYISKYQYNAYGSPIEILHPNEARETFRYNKNSKLQSYVDQEGLETRYDYDLLGRVISKIYYFDNNQIAKESFKYDSYHLIEKTDKEEGVTKYSYDGLGRKIFENFQGRETTFQYDNLGRLNLICKENSDNTLYINYERDLLDRIRKETKTGKTGKVLYEIAYTYDKDGNRESIVRNINDKQPIETFSFDSFGREIEHRDGKGNFTKTQYIENFINPINQKVLQIKKTDPKNIKTVLTYDVFSNPTNKSILDAHDAILFSVDSRYDANSNLIEIKDHIYEQNNHKKTITTRYTYTKNNLVENLIRAYGSEDEKKTVYGYTSSGRLKLKDLPIGTQLQYSYDPLGNLNKITSNDEKVNQIFKYNKLGFLLKAEDKIQQTKIERKLDSFGNILKEKFNDNLAIEKSYDNFNRPLLVKLHNAGEVRYRYDPLYIREVTRSSDNKLQYQHNFDEYDLNGDLQKENHIYDLASTKYERDLNGKTIQINNPYFFQTCEYDECGNLIKSIIDNDEHNYSYDELEQLTKEESDRYESESGYDSNYNRIINNQDEAIINDLDELIQIGDIKLSYDKNGNVTCKETTESCIDFTFDPLNRLLDAKTEKASIKFSYDAIGRRLSKSVNKEGWFTSSYSENYLYDNKQEIGAFDTNDYSKNLKILSYYPNSSFSKVIAIEIAGSSYLPIFDIQGNIIKLINSWGSVKQKYDYTSFGEKLNEESLENPWQYQAKRFDSEIDLIYFGKRYYDPQVARWTSVDPAGFVDGLNLYNYLKNNPFKYFDLEGNFAFAIPILVPVAKIVFDIIVASVVITTVKWAGDTVIHKINEAQTKTEPKAQEKKGKQKPPPYSGEELGDDPTECPGKGFEWKGKGDPKSGKGNWYNPKTDESLHPDFNHPLPKKPHWDYEGPDFPNGARLNTDGTWEPK